MPDANVRHAFKDDRDYSDKCLHCSLLIDAPCHDRECLLVGTPLRADDSTQPTTISLFPTLNNAVQFLAQAPYAGRVVLYSLIPIYEYIDDEYITNV